MRDERRPTESLREEHAHMRRDLDRVEGVIRSLLDLSLDSRRSAMEDAVDFLRREIAPHGEWEERALYPMVDRFRPCGGEVFTEGMRHEHRIVERWVDDLARELVAERPDVRAFTCKALQILGLVRAHMEVEEEVFLAALDRKMTHDQFDEEIGTFAEYR